MKELSLVVEVKLDSFLNLHLRKLTEKVLGHMLTIKRAVKVLDQTQIEKVLNKVVQVIEIFGVESG